MTRLVPAVVLLELALYAVSPKEVVAPSYNVVENPGFEQSRDDSGLPLGWQCDVRSGSYRCRLFSVAEEKRNVHSGNSSLEFAGTAGEAAILSSPTEVEGRAIIAGEAFLKTEYCQEAISSVNVDLDVSGGRVVRTLSSSESSNTDDDGDWRRVSFLQEVERSTGETKSQARLAIRLKGEALVHIDDAMMHRFDYVKIIRDGGFEDIVADRVQHDWSIASHTAKNEFQTIQDEPHGGAACIRMTGNDDWKVLFSPLLHAKPRQMIVRAYARVSEGVGGMKIEYFGTSPQKVEKCFIPKSDGWTPIVLISNPKYIAEASSFRITLVACRRIDGTDPADAPKSYTVDFDDVELFVVK